MSEDQIADKECLDCGRRANSRDELLRLKIRELTEALRIAEETLNLAMTELGYAPCRDNPEKTFCEKCRCEKKISSALDFIRDKNFSKVARLRKKIADGVRLRHNALGWWLRLSDGSGNCALMPIVVKGQNTQGVTGILEYFSSDIEKLLEMEAHQ
jgi:hypothetical protein